VISQYGKASEPLYALRFQPTPQSRRSSPGSSVGKKVEDAIFAIVVSEARAMGTTVLTATYRPTAKNKPCLEFLERSGFHRGNDGATFSLNTADEFNAPDHIRLVPHIEALACSVTWFDLHQSGLVLEILRTASNATRNSLVFSLPITNLIA
jgi:hypothetical protein